MTESGNATLFHLPSACPPVVLSACPNFEVTSSVILEPIIDEHEEPESIAEPLSTPKRREKAKGKAPLSKADVRRSNMLKLIHKGFKTSACKDRNCLGYSSTPPPSPPRSLKIWVQLSVGSTLMIFHPLNSVQSQSRKSPWERVK